MSARHGVTGTEEFGQRESVAAMKKIRKRAVAATKKIRKRAVAATKKIRKRGRMCFKTAYLEEKSSYH